MRKRVIGKRCKEIGFKSCDVIVDTSVERCDKCGGELEIVEAADKRLVTALSLAIALLACGLGYLALIASSDSAAPTQVAKPNQVAKQGASSPVDVDKEKIIKLLQQIYSDGIKTAEEQSKIGDLIHNQAIDAQWLSEQEQQIRGRISEASPFTKSGLFYAAREDYRRAAEEFKRSLEINDGNTLMWANLAAAYIKLNELGQAKYACDRAIALDSHNWLAHYNLSAVHASKGDKDAAVFELSEVIRLLDEDQSQQITKGQVTDQMRVDESLDSLRSDPRFQQLLARNR